MPEIPAVTQEQRRQLQDHISGIESRLRRRLTGRLAAVGSFDVDDILDSARRRLDRMIVEGRLSFLPDTKLTAYIKGVAERIAREKFRKYRRQVRLETFIASHRGVLVEQSDSIGDEELVQHVLARLDVPDRQLLGLWVLGFSSKQIAMRLCIGVECLKSRRRRVWTTLRSLLSAQRQPERD